MLSAFVNPVPVHGQHHPRERATTRATAHAIRNGGATTKSPAALWPGKLTSNFVSWDQRPPTSTPATTNRALLRRPTSSGHLRSFLLFAAVKATPSSTEAPRLADPSPRRMLTVVASIACWAPPNRGNPSTATSSRLSSALSAISNWSENLCQTPPETSVVAFREIVNPIQV